jgi:hypothetical protein
MLILRWKLQLVTKRSFKVQTLLKPYFIPSVYAHGGHEFDWLDCGAVN